MDTTNSSSFLFYARHGSSVGCAFAWYADGRGFDPHVRQHSFMEIGHEIISTAILSLPVIQYFQTTSPLKPILTIFHI